MDETNLNQFREVAPSGTLTLQNSSLVKVWLSSNGVQAKLDSMVAYQGEVRETSHIAFEGPGWVLIQSSEGPTVLPCTHVRQG